MASRKTILAIHSLWLQHYVLLLFQDAYLFLDRRQCCTSTVDVLLSNALIFFQDLSLLECPLAMFDSPPYLSTLPISRSALSGYTGLMTAP